MNKEFEVHMLNPEGVQKARKIAEHFDALLNSLRVLIPQAKPSRGMQIVSLKLEEAYFFAKKELASLPENQKTTA